MISFYQGKTVAVTGGLGLIGSFLCEELCARGGTVILIDDESKGSWRYLPTLRERVVYRKRDLADPKQALETLAESEYVFHLASPASPEHYVRLGLETIRVNTVGLLLSLEFANTRNLKNEQ